MECELTMGIFGFIAKKKEQFKEKQLNMAQIKAKALEEKAEKHAKEMEKLTSHHKALQSALKSQQESKAIIQQTKRMQHPLLYKIGDSVKQKFAEAQKNKTHTKLVGNTKSSNVFSQVGNQQPYWLKQSKSSNKDLFGNSKSNQSIFTSTQTPYWLKQNKKRK